jgi:dUTP pyrophosphatase
MSGFLKYIKMYPDSLVPTKATSESVGHDLYAYTDAKISPRGLQIISTGIKVQPPAGSYIRLASRSGLASKGITVQGGVIDPDYTGEIKVILNNHTDSEYIISKGMKVCQMIAEKYTPLVLLQLSNFEETERGARGFGSSGFGFSCQF